MSVGRDLEKIDEEQIKEIAEEKDLIPGIIKGTEDGIQFANPGSEKVDETDWDTFFDIIDRKNLAVYSTKEGWMKIMHEK